MLSQLLLAATAYSPHHPPGKWGYQAVVEVCSSPPEPQQQQLSSLRLWQNRENKLTL
jgi:hypothetical protein